MLLAYFILAHLLGDFVFQPTKLVLWKIKSKKGGIVHALIHFVVLLIVVSPLIVSGYFGLILVAFGLSFVHFFVDQAKINYDLKHDTKVKPFVLDQLIHLLAILTAYFFINDLSFSLPNSPFYKIYTDIRIVNLVSFLVFASGVIEVYSFQKQRESDKNAKLKVQTGKMLNRIIVFTLLYVALMALAFYASGENKISL